MLRSVCSPPHEGMFALPGASPESARGIPLSMTMPNRAFEQSAVRATDEERELVRRMRAGEERAFEAFADHYIPALHRFASSRVREDRELVRELVQATVVKAIEHLDGYRGEAPLFTWLCACCRNEIAMHFRRNPSWRSVAPVEEGSGDDETMWPGDTPEDVAIGNERDDLVHQALDHLPPRYAAALEWKYLRGESVNEIAARMEITAKAAESLLTRSRLAFRSIWERLTVPGETIQ